MLSERRVILYGRPGCHLCAAARVLLDRLASGLDFSVTEIDIDTDAELLARFDACVPVVAVGEVEIARAPLEAQTLEQRLREVLSSG